MENLIYIIIGIAWVAYSVYTSRQKAIQKQQNSGLPPKGPSQSSPLPIPGNQGGGKTLFEDIFRELTAEPKPVPQVVKPVIPNKPLVADKPISTKNVSEFNVAYEGYSGYKFISGVQSNSFQVEPEKNPKTQEKYAQMTNDERIFKKIDLREAVISSELLNRKYF